MRQVSLPVIHPSKHKKFTQNSGGKTQTTQNSKSAVVLAAWSSAQTSINKLDDNGVECRAFLRLANATIY
jgi:hypothetical protein